MWGKVLLFTLGSVAGIIGKLVYDEVKNPSSSSRRSRCDYDDDDSETETGGRSPAGGGSAPPSAVSQELANLREKSGKLQGELFHLRRRDLRDLNGVGGSAEEFAANLAKFKEEIDTKTAELKTVNDRLAELEKAESAEKAALAKQTELKALKERLAELEKMESSEQAVKAEKEQDEPRNTVHGACCEPSPA
jgi:seryl-tRNA synthetase